MSQEKPGPRSGPQDPASVSNSGLPQAADDPTKAISVAGSSETVIQKTRHKHWFRFRLRQKTVDAMASEIRKAANVSGLAAACFNVFGNNGLGLLVAFLTWGGLQAVAGVIESINILDEDKEK